MVYDNMSWSMTKCQSLCTGLSYVEDNLVNPEIGGAQVASGASFNEAFIYPFFDGTKSVAFADIQELSDFQLGLAAPRMIGAVG